MSKKLFFTLLLIEFLIITALISRNGSITLLAIPFLIFLGIGLMTVPREWKIEVQRELSVIRINENEPVTMRLTIKNDGKAIPRVHLLEPTFRGMNLIEGSDDLWFYMGENETIKIGYKFTALRGSYNWQSVKLVTSDPFGLFEKHIEFNTPGRVFVLPGQVELRHSSYHPLPNIRTAGPNLSRLPGSGIDFWGVREYHAGDSLRSIHWRMTARHPQKFFSKEFEREEIADIGLLLDARSVTNQSSDEPALFEKSIQAAASLAKYFLSSGNRVSMLILNDQLVRVFPGYGKHQLVRILDELSICEMGDRVSFDTLKYLPVKLFPNRSLITVISPLLPDDFSILSRLKAEGYQLLVVSPESQKRKSLAPVRNPYQSYARRIEKLERDVLLRQIQRIHVPVIAWDVNQQEELARQFSGLVRGKVR
mgnify:CR=1 FL=1